MRKKEVTAKLNKASILFFLLSSLIILMLPFADSEINPALSIASGVIFWAGLILGIVCYYLSYKNIKDVQEYQTLAKEIESVHLHRKHKRRNDRRYSVRTDLCDFHFGNLCDADPVTGHAGQYVDRISYLIWSLCSQWQSL